MGITAKKAAELLNEMLALEPYATKQLVENRIFCNAGLVNHPTIQVGLVAGHMYVGFLGVLNGILLRGQNDGKVVAAVYDEQNKLIRFEVRNYEK